MRGIGCAGHEPLGFEAIQDEGDVAAVDPEPSAEGRLAERPELGQAGEHGVVRASRGGDGLDNEPVGVAREVADQPCRGAPESLGGYDLCPPVAGALVIALLGSRLVLGGHAAILSTVGIANSELCSTA